MNLLSYKKEESPSDITFIKALFDVLVSTMEIDIDGDSVAQLRTFFEQLTAENCEHSILCIFENPLLLGGSRFEASSDSVRQAIYHVFLLYPLLKKRTDMEIPTPGSDEYYALFNEEIEPGVTPASLAEEPVAIALREKLLQVRDAFDAKGITQEDHQEGLLEDYSNYDTDAVLTERAHTSPETFIFYTQTQNPDETDQVNNFLKETLSRTITRLCLEQKKHKEFENLYRTIASSAITLLTQEEYQSMKAAPFASLDNTYPPEKIRVFHYMKFLEITESIFKTSLKLFLIDLINVRNKNLISTLLAEENYVFWNHLINECTKNELLTPELTDEDIFCYITLQKTYLISKENLEYFLQDRKRRNQMSFALHTPEENKLSVLHDLIDPRYQDAALFVGSLKQQPSNLTLANIQDWLFRTGLTFCIHSQIFVEHIVEKTVMNKSQAVVCDIAHFTPEEFRSITPTEWRFLILFCPIFPQPAFIDIKTKHSVRAFLAELRIETPRLALSTFLEKLNRKTVQNFGSFVNFNHIDFFNTANFFCPIQKSETAIIQWSTESSEELQEIFYLIHILKDSLKPQYQSIPAPYKIYVYRDLLLASKKYTQANIFYLFSELYILMFKNYGHTIPPQSLFALTNALFKNIIDNAERRTTNQIYTKLSGAVENLLEARNFIEKPEELAFIFNIFLYRNASQILRAGVPLTTHLYNRFDMTIYPGSLLFINILSGLTPTIKEDCIGFMTNTQTANLFLLLNNELRNCSFEKTALFKFLSEPFFDLGYDQRISLICNSYTVFDNDFSFEKRIAFYKNLFTKNPVIKEVLSAVFSSEKYSTFFANTFALYKKQAEKDNMLEDLVTIYSYLLEKKIIPISNAFNFYTVSLHVRTILTCLEPDVYLLFVQLIKNDKFYKLCESIEKIEPSDAVFSFFEQAPKIAKIKQLIQTYCVERNKVYSVKTQKIIAYLADKMGTSFSACRKGKTMEVVGNLTPENLLELFDRIEAKPDDYAFILDPSITTDQLFWIFNNAMIVYNPRYALKKLEELKASHPVFMHQAIENLKKEKNYGFSIILSQNNNKEPIVFIEENINNPLFIKIWTHNSSCSHFTGYMLKNFAFISFSPEQQEFLAQFPIQTNELLYPFCSFLGHQKHEIKIFFSNFCAMLDDTRDFLIARIVDAPKHVPQMEIYIALKNIIYPGFSNFRSQFLNKNLVDAGLYTLYGNLSRTSALNLWTWLKASSSTEDRDALCEKVCLFFLDLTAEQKNHLNNLLKNSHIDLQRHGSIESRFESFLDSIQFDKQKLYLLPSFNRRRPSSENTASAASSSNQSYQPHF